MLKSCTTKVSPRGANDEERSDEHLIFSLAERAPRSEATSNYCSPSLRSFACSPVHLISLTSTGDLLGQHAVVLGTLNLQLLLRLLADDVGNVVTLVDVLVVLEHLLRDLDVGHGLSVRVVVRVLVQSLGDDELLEGELPLPHLGGNFLQMSVDLLDNSLAVQAAEDALHQHVQTAVLRLDAPVSPDQIQALQLVLVRNVALAVLVRRDGRVPVI